MRNFLKKVDNVLLFIAKAIITAILFLLGWKIIGGILVYFLTFDKSEIILLI